VQRAVLPGEHWPHAPLGWQAGVAGFRHSPSLAQARHSWVATLHTGVTPPHSASVMQLTQVPLGTWQAGVTPVHLILLVAEQTPQAPLGWQAGVAPVPHSPSAAQPRHVFVAVSQTGVEPPHCASEVHGTQVPLDTLQTGVPPPQRTAFVVEHWRQAPFG
jgi:hypothetical protein